MQICVVAVRDIAARSALPVVLFGIHWRGMFCSCGVGCAREHDIRKDPSGSVTQYVFSGVRGKTQQILRLNLSQALLASMAMTSSPIYGGDCCTISRTSGGWAGAEGATNMNCVYSLGICTEEGKTLTTGGWLWFLDFRYAVLCLEQA